MAKPQLGPKLNPWRTGAVIMTGLYLMGCATTADIFVDQDPKQDFSTYKTFGWAKTEPMTVNSDYELPITVKPELETAIKNTLIDKGYTFTVDVENADFAIAYTIGARDAMQVDSYPSQYLVAYNDWGWGRQYYPSPVMAGPMYAPPVDRYSAYTTTQGTLAVDLYDVKQRRPVWHGVAQEQISESSLDKGKVDLKKVVKGLFADFGPAPTQ